MKTVTLVLGAFDGSTQGDVIGVDAGALVCMNKGISMTLACGDFDSVDADALKRIKNYADRFIQLPVAKDDTDFSFAIKQCDAYDTILVLGGLGRRRDHEYVHVATAIQDTRIQLRDAQNLIRYYQEGTHTISKKDYTYVGIIVTEAISVTLDGFKYPLTRRNVTPHDTYLTSNEILGDTGTVRFEGGGALVIQSKD